MNDKPLYTFFSMLKVDEREPEEKKQVSLLADFLEKACHLDPNKRMLPEEALQHPFINPYNSL